MLQGSKESTYMVVRMWVNRNASYAICLKSLKLLRVRIVKPASPTKPCGSALDNPLADLGTYPDDPVLGVPESASHPRSH